MRPRIQPGRRPGRFLHLQRQVGQHRAVPALPGGDAARARVHGEAGARCRAAHVPQAGQGLHLQAYVARGMEMRGGQVVRGAVAADPDLVVVTR